ncbi:MAG: GntR family transcriptional regulator [Planctomycetota bacterium]|jgi:DNA-binding LacI/PurR family transcriptional regulator|nr:GntR family transcriptional regulator [Planctomycetota bacterium]
MPSNIGHLPYEIVRDTLRDEIDRGVLSEGSRLPTTTELRARFGVSIATLQKALGELVDAGMIERHPRRGSFVRRASAAGTVCLLLGTDVFRHENAAFHAVMIDAFRSEAARAGLNVELKMLLDDDAFAANAERFGRELDLGLYGLVVSFFGTRRLHTWLKDRKAPCLNRSGAAIDYANLGAQGVRYLAAQGFEHLMVLMPQGNVVAGKPEHDGIAQALAELGAQAPSCEFIEGAPSDSGGREAMHQRLASPVPANSAILSFNDVMTRGALFCLLEAGLHIPDDIGFLTHANQGVPLLSSVPLSTLMIDPKQIAAHWVQACLAALRGTTAANTTIHAQLIAGRSCRETAPC